MITTESSTYIYALTDSFGNVRYIGKANDLSIRYKNHLSENNRTKKCNWVKSLIARGENPVMIHLDKNNNCINEFPSIKTAQEETNIPDGNIVSVCKGKRKTAGGFKWKYKNQ